MLTVYKQDLKEQLHLRQGELKSLLAEREQLISEGAYNPFKRKQARDLRENLIHCFKEVNRLTRMMKNKSY